MTDDSAVEPPNTKTLGPSWPYIAASRTFALCGALWVSWGDPWFLCILLLLLLLSIPYAAWTGQARLSPRGLARRTFWTGWELIPWARVQDVVVERARYYGHRIEVLDRWDPELKRANRVVLGVGASFFRLGRTRQKEALAEIRRWWLEHRGHDWAPVQPAPKFRFPRSVGPPTPPAHD